MARDQLQYAVAELSTHENQRVTKALNDGLQAALEWSYDLLSQPERRLFNRLSVFAGGWTLEAAETVCAGDGVEASEVLDLVARQVNKSLVVADPAATRLCSGNRS